MIFEKLTGRDQSHLELYKEAYFDKDMLISYKRLEKDLEPFGIELAFTSCYRNFDRQLLTWNEKARGNRKLYNKEGRLVQYNDLSKKELLECIMSWSAIPGASRHHWGSDIDVFDATQKERSKVELLNEEYENDGEFTFLTQKLNEMMKDYDFFRPYAKYKGGVSKELWHLSFSPVSIPYLEAYTLEMFERNIIESQMELKDLLLDRLDEFYQNYVLNICAPH